MEMEFLTLKNLPGEEGNVCITVGSDKPYAHLEFTLLAACARNIFDWLQDDNYGIGSRGLRVSIGKNWQANYLLAWDSKDGVCFKLVFGSLAYQWYLDRLEIAYTIDSGAKAFGIDLDRD